jgi:hypothetical protein
MQKSALLSLQHQSPATFIEYPLSANSANPENSTQVPPTHATRRRNIGELCSFQHNPAHLADPQPTFFFAIPQFFNAESACPQHPFTGKC